MAYLGHNPPGYPHPFETPTIFFRPRTKQVVTPDQSPEDEIKQSEELLKNGEPEPKSD